MKHRRMNRGPTICVNGGEVGSRVIEKLADHLAAVSAIADALEHHCASDFGKCSPIWDL